MKTFLVTGAAGFIGGAVAAKLLSEGYAVVTIDNLSTGFEDAIPNGVKFVKGDVQDAEVINKLNDYVFEAIFHIAGQSSGEISFDNPVYDLQTNTQSTLLLLKLAMKTKCEKFIYASTMSVYGDQPDKPVTELNTVSPKSFYGVGKLASEHYLKIYQEYGINCTSLRLFNVYGPGQNLSNLRQGMVSIFLAMAIKSGEVHVKGGANRFRDFVYIDDVVDAFMKSLNKASLSYDILNVCTGVKNTVGNLINNITSNLNSSITVEYKGGTPGDQFGIIGDNSLANKIINWKPKTSLDEGLKTMVNWALKLENH